MLILIRTIKGKFLPAEAARFIVAGSFNTLFCYIVFILSLCAGLGGAQAMTIATLLTIFVSYFVMSRFVFVRDFTFGRYLRFFVMQGIGYVINIGMLQILMLAGISEYLGGIVSLLFAAIFTFFASKYLVFT